MKCCYYLWKIQKKKKKSRFHLLQLWLVLQLFQSCRPKLIPLQTVEADGIARNLSHLDLLCHSFIAFWLNPLFATMDMSSFRDKRVHLRNSGVKALRVNTICEYYLSVFAVIKILYVTASSRFSNTCIPNGTCQAKKMSSNMYKMCRFRSSCACTKCHPGLCFPFIHSVVSNDFVNRQWMSWSDCTDVQADLDLRCLRMSKDVFAWHSPYLHLIFRHLKALPLLFTNLNKGIFATF